MKIGKTLSGYLKVKAEERPAFRQLFLLSLFTGISISFYFVAVNTFLIQKTSVSNLPFAYIISGLVGFFLIKFYQNRQKRTSIIKSYYESIIAFSVVSLLIYFAFVKYSGNAGLGVYLAYLGFLFNMPFTIIFSLGFFAVCARIFNLSQSKRLLALVGTGETIASILSYLIAPVVIKYTGGTVNLLLISSVCALLSFIPLAMLSKLGDGKLKAPATTATSKKINIAFFLKDNFFLLIAAASIFSVAAIYFVDYSYLISVRFMAAETGIQVAAIVSVFFTVVKTGELTFSLLSGSVLSSRGIKFCILLLPFILTGCFLLAFLAGFGLENAIFLIAFIFLAKWSERVVRKAITTPATKVLYQVTGSSDRLQIEANIEGLLNQLSTIITGSALLLFSHIFSGKHPMPFLSAIAVICFVAFLIWLFLSSKLYNSYKQKIREYLDQLKHTSALSDTFVSEDTGEVLQRLLDAVTPYPQVQETVTNAVKMLREQNPTLQTVAYYNPSILHSMYDEGILHRKLINAYYVNENFFSRLSIIRYLTASDINLRLFRELWKISDLHLKLELIMAYNRGNAEEKDVYFFESLCEEYAREIVWALSAEHDLAAVDDQALQQELMLHQHLLKSILFELLKTMYEPSSVQVIADIMNNENQDIENQFFALELLDNILNRRLKDILMPVFEPLPFDQKIDSLKKVFAVYNIEVPGRLKDILMKDFKSVNPAMKELALIDYYKITGDRKLIEAFSHSKLLNLSLRATQLLTIDAQADALNRRKLFSQLINDYHLNKTQAAYLSNWGLHHYISGKRRLSVLNNAQKKEYNPYLVNMNLGADGNFVVDGFAMALLIS